jgi:hypothetical protein
MTSHPRLLAWAFDFHASLRIPNFRWFIVSGLSITVAAQRR